MKVAIYSKSFDRDTAMVVRRLQKTLCRYGCEPILHSSLQAFLQSNDNENASFVGYYDLHHDTRYLVCVGGDGTFLESINLIRDRDISVMGINTGRLGFLSNISRTDLDKFIKKMAECKLSTEERTLLRVTVNNKPAFDFPCALNDAVIHKSTAGLMTVHSWCNGEPLNSYWADGVIVSTPTGSTAYTLSVGGPIVASGSQNFIISPIAAHNLNVRPLVIPDSVTLKLQPECRSKDGYFTLSMDSRSVECRNGSIIEIKRADFKIKTIKSTSFYYSLRNKLMWGMDKRNIAE